MYIGTLLNFILFITLIQTRTHPSLCEPCSKSVTPKV